MNKHPCIIFDIDGTLADNTHRQHFLAGGKKDWKSFLSPEELAKDTPNQAVVQLANILIMNGTTIVLCSGRAEARRKVTEEWLAKHLVYVGYGEYLPLYMRANGDHRPDTVVKKELLGHIRETYYPWLVIDDRTSVVKMWREEGLTCLQCAEGEF